MKIKFLFAISAFTLFTLVLSSCHSDEVLTSPTSQLSSFDNKVIVDWNETFLLVERYAAGYRPGPAPRAIGLIGLANYEATVSATEQYQSVAGKYPGLIIPQADAKFNYHWPTVVNTIYASMMKSFFPKVSSTVFQNIISTETVFANKYKAEIDPTRYNKSKAYGEAVASAVWEWSKSDTYGHDAYNDPFNTSAYDWKARYKKEGDWTPSKQAGPGKPMFPLWGKVRTFAINDGDKLIPPPIAYSKDKNSAYYAQGLETYAQSAPTQSFEAKWVGEFWSDDLTNLTFSPGPRWLAIANQAYVKDKVNLEKAIVVNAKIGMALSDAAVACWYSKYYYNLERPDTYIQKEIDPTWKSALNNPLTGDIGFTPPFPAYPSGHATMGAAGAEILTQEFGASYPLTDRCHENRNDFIGKPRSFGSFYEMADENGWSRMPLGVHWRMDAEQGVRLGYRCARKVETLKWKKN
jgi:membrane-associated phospholipid phosphatase